MTSNGQLLSNNQNLLDDYHVYKSNSNSFVNNEGKTMEYTPIAERLDSIKTLAYQCQNDPTGPYYRVKTRAGLASSIANAGISQFSYASANLYLPSGNSVNINSNSNGYVMFGGWGRASTPTQSNAADVGLQYNAPYSNNPQEDYSIFMVSVDKSNQSKKSFITGQRYKPVDIKMAFYVYSDNVLALKTEGTPENTSNPSRVTTFLSAPGWIYSGEDNIIKRLTSTTNYTSGQYFRNVEWFDMRLGRRRTASSTDGISDVVDNLHTWGNSSHDYDIGTDGICSSPTAAVSIKNLGSGVEVVSIY